MISSAMMNKYWELAFRVLHSYMPDTVIALNSYMSDDRRVLQMEQLLSTDPTESQVWDWLEAQE